MVGDELIRGRACQAPGHRVHAQLRLSAHVGAPGERDSLRRLRFGILNVPLDRWSEPATLYHLHGSVARHRSADGLVSKPRLEQIREHGLLDAWTSGKVERGLPAVILGDLKSR